MTIWDEWAKIPGWDQVKGSSSYLRATPSFQQHIHDILWKYGMDPGNQADMAGSPIDFSNDPYSIVNMLKRTQVEANHGTINTANAAGLEESGAAAAGLNANNEDYKRNYAGAVAAEGQEISGALGNYTDLVGGLFDDAEKNPVTQPAPAAPVTPGAPPASVGLGLPVPQGPYQRTGPETPSRTTVAQKLKPKVLIKGSHGLTPGGGY